MDINDLDDPLDEPINTSSSAPLNPNSLTSAIPGDDRRAPSNTLDESVWDTLSRDLRAIWVKLLAVLYPKFSWKRWPDASDVLESGGSLSGFGGGAGSGAGIGDWDLWGPLVFCLLLSTLLSFRAKEAQKQDVFAGVFALVWIGEAVVTGQIMLLGGNM